MKCSINLFLFGLLSVLFFAVSCRKHLSGNDATGPEMLTQARAFVDSLNSSGYPVNYRASQPKKIRWDLARAVTIGQAKGILVPIVFDNALLMRANFAGEPLFHLDYLTQLLYYKDTSGKSTAFVLTAFPDSNFFKNPTAAFTGIKFIEDWRGHRIEKLLYALDGSVKRYDPKATQPALAEVIQTCYTISGYNY